VAKDADEALRYLAQHSNDIPGLILLDINMPKTNGIEFLLMIKNSSNFKKIPVVVLTTSNAAQDVLRSYESGAAGYLIKDMDYHKFVHVMNALISYWNVCELP
jgi:CheY-like chemotaxis protein